MITPVEKAIYGPPPMNSYGFRLIDSMVKGDSRGFAKQIGFSAMSREADTWRRSMGI
jgi:hypothetical protein